MYAFIGEKNLERSTRVNESRGDDLYICFFVRSVFFLYRY